MPGNEQKLCPRCQNGFECKSASIEICQCRAVTLTNAQREDIRARFDDCLCASCLRELSLENDAPPSG